MTISFSGLRRTAMICALPALLASPVAADPTIGLGLSLSYGGGNVNTGIGLRVFSDDRRDTTVGSIGLDYMFGSQSWRGTVGAAYLGKRGYVGLDLGIGLQDGAIDIGVGLGGVNTKSRSRSRTEPDGETGLEPDFGGISPLPGDLEPIDMS